MCACVLATNNTVTTSTNQIRPDRNGLDVIMNNSDAVIISSMGIRDGKGYLLYRHTTDIYKYKTLERFTDYPDACFYNMVSPKPGKFNDLIVRLQVPAASLY
jgi:hypothetical protein